MADLYDLTLLTQNGFVGFLQAINTYSDGALGPVMLLSFSAVLFIVLIAFGLRNIAWFATCFNAFIIALLLVSIEILSLQFFYVIIIINVINVLLAIFNN